MTDPFVIPFLIATPVMMIWLAVRQFWWKERFIKFQQAVMQLQNFQFETTSTFQELNGKIDSDTASHTKNFKTIDENFKQTVRDLKSLKDQLAREIENGCVHDAVITELEEQIIPELRSQLAAYTQKLIGIDARAEGSERAILRLQDFHFDVQCFHARLEALEKPRTTAAISNLAKAISKKRITLPQRRAISAPKARVKANGRGVHAGR